MAAAPPRRDSDGAMRFPIVTETTPRLEAVTPDPFIVAISGPAALLHEPASVAARAVDAIVARLPVQHGAGG
jgi:hypothetical protein